MTTLPQSSNRGQSPRRQELTRRFEALSTDKQMTVLHGMMLMLTRPQTATPPAPVAADQARIDATCRDLLVDILPDL